MKGPETVGTVLTQGDGLKINWCHAYFQETGCANARNASQWNVLLCGRYLFNRNQKIAFAGFIINFRVAPIHRELMLDGKLTSLSFMGAH